MKIISFLTSVFLVILFGFNTVAQVQTKQHVKIVRKTTLKYLLWLPASYKTDKKKQFPLLIFLHGSGERGDSLELVKRNGPPSFIDSRSDFPFVTISPQCAAGTRWNIDDLQEMLQLILKHYHIDTNRIYLTGLSMGGFGTWSWATKYPKQFAAIAPVCGGGDIQFARELKHLPIWAFHGEADPVVPVNRTIEMVDAVNASGGSARMTIYPGVGHDSWINAYNDPQLYTWLLEHVNAK